MAYLTKDEYVNRFGQAETVRITDETKTGVVDIGKVTTAIGDATQFADSYLGGRYTLPIANPPEILKGIVAALAREALYNNNPPLMVTTKADQARAQLKDLSAGRATLPVPEGVPPPVTLDTGGAVTSGDARPRVFTSCRMADFTEFRGGGFRTGPMG